MGALLALGPLGCEGVEMEGAPDEPEAVAGEPVVEERPEPEREEPAPAAVAVEPAPEAVGEPTARPMPPRPSVDRTGTSADESLRLSPRVNLPGRRPSSEEFAVPGE
jgi:hypothetical protein